MGQVFMTFNAVGNLIILLLGTICNSMVIYAFLKIKSLHTINNIFLCQLAVVDLTKSVLILPVKVYFQLKASELSNQYICQSTAFISSFTYLHSSALLAMIAVVRYFKILKPFKFGHVFSARNVVGCSVLLVVLSCIISSLPVVGLGRYKFSIYHGICFADWSSINSVYRSLFYAFTIGINYPVLIISYGKIFFALKKHKRLVGKAPEVESGKVAERIENDQDEAGHVQTTCDDFERKKEDLSDVDNYKRSRNQPVKVPCKTKRVRFFLKPKVEEITEIAQGESQGTGGKMNGNVVEIHGKLAYCKFKKEVEVTKAMFTMFIAYSLCWLPAFFVNIFMLTKVIEVSPPGLFVVVTLVELKVCLNPLIYVTWSSQYRKALRHLLLKEIRLTPT